MNRTSYGRVLAPAQLIDEAERLAYIVQSANTRAGRVPDYAHYHPCRGADVRESGAGTVTGIPFLSAKPEA